MSEMFEYDDQSSYESNFNTWYSMNSKERGITTKNPTLVLLLKEYLVSSMEENQSKKLSAIYLKIDEQGQ